MFRKYSAALLWLAVLGIGCSAAAQDAANATEEKPTELSPLEFVEKLSESDANSRFAMLEQVNPRGVDKETRAKMLALLVEQLESPYPDIRARGAMAIGLFREDAESLIPNLLKLIGDQEKTVRYRPVWNSVSKALAQIGPASIEPTLAKLESATALEYNGLAAVISELGEHEAAIASAPKFIEILRTGDQNRKWATIYCLSKLGAASEPAIPDFVKTLDDKEFNNQVIACRALTEHGSKSSDAIPRLIELTNKVRGRTISTRTHAAMCLGAVGPKESTDEGYGELIEIFKSMISEPNAFSQERGLIALGRLGHKAKGANDFIAKLLKDEEFSQRPEAAYAMWKVTGEAQPSLDILKSLIDDPTFDSRVYQALNGMGPAAAPLADLLITKIETTDDASLKLVVAEIFVEMGKPAIAYIEKLRPHAETSPPDIAIGLDEAIAEIEAMK